MQYVKWAMASTTNTHISDTNVVYTMNSVEHRQTEMVDCANRQKYN